MLLLNDESFFVDFVFVFVEGGIIEGVENVNFSNGKNRVFFLSV